MSLKESYLGNVENVKKMNPGAELIEVTRSAGSVLGPSWALLNDYKAKKITWDGYIERFVKEMDNPVSRAEMLRIGNLAKTRDVYLVCFERVGNCHRFLLVDMINTLLYQEMQVRQGNGYKYPTLARELNNLWENGHAYPVLAEVTTDVICKYCEENMGTADSCKHPLIKIGDAVYARDTTHFDKNERCHDCGILNKKGNLHHVGCDMEKCPRCGEQAFCCDCGPFVFMEA